MTTPRHLVIFDEACRLCRRSIRLLQQLDWLSRFACADQGSRQAQQARPGLSRADLERSIHVVTADGQVLPSVRALQFIALRLPVTIPLGLCLFLPGALPLAERAYGWVSRHRHAGPARDADSSCPRCES